MGPQPAPNPGLPAEPIRVAIARIANASGLSYADHCVSTLRFNGKSVAENGESFRQVVLADVSQDDQTQAEVARGAAEIASFLPHVIINGIDDPLVVAAERAWPASARFRPRWLPVDLTAPDVRAYAQQHPEVRKRLFHADTDVSTPAVAKLVLRYNEVFPVKVTAEDVQSAPYDAFYVLAYAAAAVGNERLTGPALARALPRLLPPGEPIDVGPGGIYQALSILGAGKNIDLGGTTTTLDFDLETGDADADFSFLCLAPGRAGAPPAPVRSGLFYRARARKLEGTLRCP